MKVFSIADPVFQTEPLFVVDCSYQQLQRYLKREYRIQIEDQDPRHPFVGTQLSFSAAPRRVIWMRDWGPRHMGVLVHELFHLVVRIMRDKGIPILACIGETGDNGDEAAAYLLEFFATEALKRALHARSLTAGRRRKRTVNSE